MLLWLGFIVCTSLIVYAGSRLSKYGDIIAEKTGLGRAWIGLILMASVTSLPELVTGISSVTYAGAPDIAVGDVLGSCVFNMLIIAILDAIYRIMPISAKAHQGNVLSAAFGILLLSMVALSIFLGKYVSPLGWIGPYSLLFVAIYFVAMRLIYSYEKRQIAALMKEKAIKLRYEDISKKTAFVNYGLNAISCYYCGNFFAKDWRRHCRNHRSWPNLCGKYIYRNFYILTRSSGFYISCKNRCHRPCNR